MDSHRILIAHLIKRAGYGVVIVPFEALVLPPQFQQPTAVWTRALVALTNGNTATTRPGYEREYWCARACCALRVWRRG